MAGWLAVRLEHEYSVLDYFPAVERRRLHRFIVIEFESAG
jgi:hypothetical protein